MGAPFRHAARVKVTTRDGRSFEKLHPRPPRQPGEPADAGGDRIQVPPRRAPPACRRRTSTASSQLVDRSSKLDDTGELIALLAAPADSRDFLVHLHRPMTRTSTWHRTRYANQLAAHFAASSYADAHGRHRARRSSACCWTTSAWRVAGSQTESGEIARAFAKEHGGQAAGALIGDTARVPCHAGRLRERDLLAQRSSSTTSTCWRCFTSARRCIRRRSRPRSTPARTASTC